MLSEYKTRQIEGESRRRWFSDEDWDLIVWQSATDKVTGFQICYDRERDEHALTWRQGYGFTHERVDDGEGAMPHHKQSPILVADGKVDFHWIARMFAEKGAELEPALVKFICDKLLAQQ